MPSIRTITAFAVLFLTLLNGVSPRARAADKPPVDVEDMPLKPAPVGTAHSTIGAGARGGVEGLPDIFVLAPASTAATCKTQPTVCWYLTGDTGQDIEILLSRVSDGKQVFMTKLEGRRKAGIYAWNLATQKTPSGEPLTLQQDVEYQVTFIVKKSKQDVENPQTVGLITCVARPSSLNGHPDAAAYAAAGLWYDSVADLVADLAKNPASEQPRRRLCGLAWSHDIFSPRNDKISVAAKERATQEARQRMKEFSAAGVIR